MLEPVLHEKPVGPTQQPALQRGHFSAGWQHTRTQIEKAPASHCSLYGVPTKRTCRSSTVTVSFPVLLSTVYSVLSEETLPSSSGVGMPSVLTDSFPLLLLAFLSTIESPLKHWNWLWLCAAALSHGTVAGDVHVLPESRESRIGMCPS